MSPPEIRGPTPRPLSVPQVHAFRSLFSNEDELRSADENPDNILQLAIDFAVRGRYPPGLSKDKKRAVREYLPLTTVQLLHTNMCM